MAIGYSKLAKQSRTTVPAEILQKLGVGPGSLVEWYEKDGQIFIPRKGKRAPQEKSTEPQADESHERNR